VTTSQRALRRIGSACALIGLLVITSSLAVSAKTAERGLPAEVDCAASERGGTLNCTQLWPTQPDEGLRAARAGDVRACHDYVQPGTRLFLAAAWNQSSVVDADDAEAFGCAAQACYACFCSDAGLSAWTLRRDELHPWCDGYWAAWLQSAGFKAAAIVAALLGNIVAAVLLPQLTRFERHATAAKADACEGRSMFFVSFVNSFVVTLLVHADIAPLRRFRVLFNGVHEDFDATWCDVAR
jgi:hypothetical protein